MSKLTDIAIRNTARIAEVSEKVLTLSEDGQYDGERLTLVFPPCGGPPEWCCTYLVKGRRVSVRLGKFPQMTLGQARLKWRRLCAGNGAEGTIEWTSAHDLSVGALGAAYLANMRKEGKKSADRIKWYLEEGGGILDMLGRDTPAACVTTKSIVAFLRTVTERGAHTLARDLRAYLHAMFNFAMQSEHSYFQEGSGIDWGVKINPVAIIKKDPRGKNARDRSLSAAEVKALWDWCTAREWNKRYRVVFAIKMAICTGQRPMEIAQVSSETYDRADQSVFWGTTKNDASHWIPLPRQAIELLNKMAPNENGLFFWRREFPKQFMDVNQMGATIRRYIKETGAEAFELRDLRRTWKTLAGGAGLNLEIRNRLQNHSIPGVATQHYDRYAYEREKRQAMMTWSDELDHILRTGERRPQQAAA